MHRGRRRWLWLSAAALAIAIGVGVAAVGVLGAGHDRGGTGVPSQGDLPLAAVPQDSPHTRIAAAGDTGTGPKSRITATVSQMVAQDARAGYDAVVLLGDLVYPKGDAAEAPARISDVFQPITSRGAALLPVLGNHDYMSNEQGAIMETVGRTTTWYEQRIGIVRVIVLDTEQIDSAEQTRWLRTRLSATTNAAWTIVAMHKPAYSAGLHGSTQAVQDAWVPLFEKYDVPLVLAGHDHDYQRSRAINGITYVVSGGAGTLRPTGHESFTAVSSSTRHYLDLNFNRRRVDAQAIDQTGHVLDAFSLTR